MLTTSGSIASLIMTNFYAAGMIIPILQVKNLQLLKTEELDQGHRHLEPG